MNFFAKKRIYMDYAAATPVLPEVRRAMEKYWAKDFYNPNAIYREGMAVRAAVEECRARIAKILGVARESVIFTSGGTEANVLAVRGVQASLPAGRQGRVIVEPDSHPSVQDAVRDTGSRKVVLISSASADGRLGRKIRKERRASDSEYPLVHIDASQSAQYFDVGLERLNCDLLTLDSSKLYGPKGVGALVVRKGVKLDLTPLGTPAVPLIAGFAQAMEIAARDRREEFRRLDSLSARFASEAARRFPEAAVTRILPNITNVSLPGILPEMLVLALDRASVMVSAGPACSSRDPEPPESPVRFSFGRFTTEAEVERALETFYKVAKHGKISL